jgi:hypothetical protein
MGQAMQLLGAVVVVSAYVAAQQKRLPFDSVQFLAMNALGAGILTVVAAVNRDFGFLLLEGVWTWVSTRGLLRALKARRANKSGKPKSGKPSGRFTRPAHRRGRPNPLRRVR